MFAFRWSSCGRKPECTEETHLSDLVTTWPSYMPTPGIEPGSQQWEASVLTLRQPDSPVTSRTKVDVVIFQAVQLKSCSSFFNLVSIKTTLHLFSIHIPDFSNSCCAICMRYTPSSFQAFPSRFMKGMVTSGLGSVLSLTADL